MFSMLAASVLPPAGKNGRNAIATGELLDLTVEAKPENARQLRVRFQQWLGTLGAPACLVDDLTLAIYEALTNVVEHAYPADHPHPVMQLQARVDHDQLLMTVKDHGSWRTPTERRHRGRGITMMRALTTEVHLHTAAHSTTVHLRAALPPHSGRGRCA